MSSTAVVILNWNGLHFLKRFLDGVVNNTVVSDSKVWVVDNGSTDGSEEWIRSNFPAVEYISFNQNLGFAGGYAKALEMIEATYYVLLNSDIEVNQGWLEPMVEYMESHPETAACQPKIMSYTERTSFEYAGAAGGFIDKYGYPFCRGRILNKIEEDSGQYNSVVQLFWASGACIMIRSSIYHKAGGLDQRFFAHMEEIDLCWRIHRLGYNIISIPQSRVYHIGGGTLKYDSPGKTYLNFRNNLYMLYKNLPTMGFRKKLFIRKLLDGVAALVFLFKGRPRHFLAVVRAHRDYYRAAGDLRRDREAIDNMKLSGTISNEIMLNKSIVCLFYFKRVHKFNDIRF